MPTLHPPARLSPAPPARRPLTRLARHVRAAPLILCLWAGGPPAQAVPGPPPTLPAAPSRECQDAIQTMRTYERQASSNELPFVHIQTRVAELGCARRHTFEDPEWFERTVLLFVQIFTAQNGSWKATVASCSTPGMTQLRCVDRMVNRHIMGDLLPALRVTGCGTAGDWQKVGRLIVEAAYREGWLWGAGAELTVPWQRDHIRAECLRG